MTAASEAASQTGSPWPTTLGGVRHSGQSAYFGAQTNVLQWSLHLPSTWFTSDPTIDADGTIYAGTTNSQIYAVNGDGSVRWSLDASRALGSPASGALHVSAPVIGKDGALYFGILVSDSGPLQSGVVSIAPRTEGAPARIAWAMVTGTESGSRFVSSPTIAADGTIYFCGYDGALVALNPDGTRKWSYSTEAALESSPSIGSEGTIYFGDDRGTAYAVSPDGTLKWTYSTLVGSLLTSPAIGPDETVYFTTQDSSPSLVYALDSSPDATTREKWVFRCEGRIDAAATVAASGMVYVKCGDGNIYAINSHGKPEWVFPIKAKRPFSPISIDATGTLFFLDAEQFDSSIYALNPDGSVKWTRKLTSGGSASGIAIGNNQTVYFAGPDGVLYAVGP